MGSMRRIETERSLSARSADRFGFVPRESIDSARILANRARSTSPGIPVKSRDVSVKYYHARKKRLATFANRCDTASPLLENRT